MCGKFFSSPRATPNQNQQNNMNTTSPIASLATLENAKAYAKQTNQWVFAKVLIESIDVRATDALIEELEDALDALAFPI
jgi:hypothetical protein